MKLQIGIRKQEFITELLTEIDNGSPTIVNEIERILECHLASQLESELAKRLSSPLKRKVLVKIHPIYFKSRSASLAELAVTGYETWYVKLKFSTPLDINLEEHYVTVEPISIELLPLEYWGGRHVRFRVKSKRLKTQINWEIELLHIRIPKEIFSDSIACYERSECHDSDRLIADLVTGPRNIDYDLVSFKKVITGEVYFCECSRQAHSQMLEKVESVIDQYVPDSWPHKVRNILTSAQYKEGICHLCIAKAEGSPAMLRAYGDEILTEQKAYITQVERTFNCSRSTALAEVQLILGTSRWKKETELYKVVKKIFRKHHVEREASPDWLGKQRLDIYIPEKRLAIEYQGEQHYHPISIFGGEEALIETKRRDQLKKKLCSNKNVDLVYFKFDESLSETSVLRRLRRFL